MAKQKVHKIQYIKKFKNLLQYQLDIKKNIMK